MGPQNLFGASSLAKALGDLSLAISTAKVLFFCIRRDVRALIPFMPKLGVGAVRVGARFGVPVIVAERNSFGTATLEKALQMARLRTYGGASLLTANSKEAVRAMSGAFAKPPTIWLPNAVPSVSRHAGPELCGTNFCVVSRLEPQKQIALILEAFDSGHSSIPDSHLHIFGTGSEALKLFRMATRMRSGPAIHFHGVRPFHSIPFEELRIGVLVLASRYEGQPNVVDEAISNGLVPLINQDLREVVQAVPPDARDLLSFAPRKEELAQRLAEVFQQEKPLAALQASVFEWNVRRWSRRSKARSRALQQILDVL